MNSPRSTTPSRPFAEGRIIIVVDDEDRENEGDFVAAAEKVTPETIEFMITHGRGLFCMPILPEVGRPASARPDGRSQHGPAPDAVHGAGRPHLVPHGHQRRGAGADGPGDHRPGDTVRTTWSGPATCFRSWPRKGACSAARATPRPRSTWHGWPDLTAGRASSARSLDGTGVASRERLHEIAREHGLPIVSIEALIKYRRLREKLVHRVAEADLPTRYGRGRIIGYRVQHEPGNEPIAFVMGDLQSVEAPLVRLHSSCFTGDLLDSLRCDCGDQLHMALAMIGDEGAGALIYLPQEGRGIG